MLTNILTSLCTPLSQCEIMMYVHRFLFPHLFLVLFIYFTFFFGNSNNNKRKGVEAKELEGPYDTKKGKGFLNGEKGWQDLIK